MSSIDSITLGNLRFVATAFGSHVAVRIFGALLSDDAPQGGYLVTQTEWQSLLALADTKLAGEREAERLKQQLSTLEKYVEHNNDEYRTMKEVLRAEHQECERLRAQLSAMTAARDEACDIAERLHGKIQTVSTVDYGGVLQRIAEQRAVGGGK